MQLEDKQIEFIKKGFRKAPLVLDNQGKMHIECDLSKLPLKDGATYDRQAKCWAYFDAGTGANQEQIKKAIIAECEQKGSPSEFLIKLFECGSDTPKANSALGECKEDVMKILKKKIAECHGSPEVSIQQSPANLTESKTFVPHACRFSSMFINKSKQYISEDGKSVWR